MRDCLRMQDKTSALEPDTLERRLRILRGSRLFAALADSTLHSLALCMTERRLEGQEAVFRQGDESHGLYAILAGQVRIVIGGPDGREHVLRVLAPGEMFGEIGMLDGHPRSADAFAVTCCRLLLLERRSLLTMIAADPALAIGLIEILCDRLRDTSIQIEGLLFQNLSERLASVLLNLVLDREQAFVDITQTELSRLTGVTRESINKKLRAWQTQRLVALRPGRITILDKAKLKRLLPFGRMEERSLVAGATAC